MIRQQSSTKSSRKKGARDEGGGGKATRRRSGANSSANDSGDADSTGAAKISENGVNSSEKIFGLESADSPCHQVADSLFSSSSGFNNYRGILNLCIILLALTTGRAALENVMKYGILIDPIIWTQIFMQNPYHWPCFFLLLASNIFILAGFSIELLLLKRRVSEKTGFLLSVINQHASVIVAAAVVLYVHPSPVTSSPTLAVYVCLYLKLISYQQVNRWCREQYHALTSAQRALLRERVRTESTISNGSNGSSVKLQVYPDNLRLDDLYYFMLAPTLCYELNFPRTRRIRKRFLLKRIVEMVFLCGLILSLIQQWIVPTVNNSLVSFKELNFLAMAERLLKLAVPNHFIWLIFFYWLFHSSLNVTAELLCFGDRIFYRDWWNADTVQYFWQTWNIPVHKWALRHLYKPMINNGFSKMQSNVVVFIVSAIFHEYLVSVPLRMFRLWAFLGLLGQIPLTMLTRVYISQKYGNMIVWMSLIIGQPAAILMYYHDYYVETQGPSILSSLGPDLLRAAMNTTFI